MPAAGGERRAWSLRRVFWLGAAVLLGIAALVSIAAVLRGDFTDTDTKILGTVGSLFLTGSAALAGLALVERRTLVALGWAIVGNAAPWFVFFAVALWTETESDTVGRWVGTGLVLLAAELVLATNRLLLQNERAWPVVVFTWLSLFVATTITIANIWSNDVGEGAGKAMATFWILTVLGYFLTPVLQRFVSAGPETGAAGPRTVAVVAGAELVATRAPDAGAVAVRASRDRLTVRADGRDEELGEGELLVLRRVEDAREGEGR